MNLFFFLANKNNCFLLFPSAEKYIQEFIRDLISKSVGIIVSHPLDVIAIRMMAQFVGDETKYT